MSLTKIKKSFPGKVAQVRQLLISTIKCFHKVIKSHNIYILLGFFLKMSIKLGTSRRQSIAMAIKSQTSSDDIPDLKKKDRMRNIAALKSKQNSVIGSIMNIQTPKDYKSQSSTLFQSERWDFKPKTDESLRNSLTSSCKIGDDNPFLRAKLKLLNEKKISANFSHSGKSFEDETEDPYQHEQFTTFRLLKKGSVNTPLSSSFLKQL